MENKDLLELVKSKAKVWLTESYDAETRAQVQALLDNEDPTSVGRLQATHPYLPPKGRTKQRSLTARRDHSLYMSWSGDRSALYQGKRRDEHVSE